MAGAVVLAQTAPASQGDKVEVREGDSWTKVTVVKKEGRQTLIKYDDGTEEWVGADRLRTGSGDAGAPAGRSSKAAFVAGDQVEFKKGLRWEPGAVERTQRGWYLTADKDRKNFYWMPPWAVRLAGTAYDMEGWNHEKRVSADEAAPLQPPGRPPKVTGNPFEMPGADGKISLLGPFTDLSLDGAQEPGSPSGKPVPAFPATRPTMDFSATTIRPQHRRIDGIVLCYDTPGLALIQFGPWFDDPAEIVRFDTATHRQIDKRVMPVTKQRVVGAAEGGKTILTLPAEGFPKTMHVWELDGSKYRLKANYKPSNDEHRHIIQARMLSATRVVCCDSAADTFLFDLAGNKALGVVRAKKDTRFYVHPTGKIIGVTTASDTVLLLNADDFSTLAEYTDAAGRGGISVDPTGTSVAYMARGGAIRVAAVADGATIGSVDAGKESWNRPNEFDLLSPEMLLLGHQTVHETRSGMPIWIYSVPRDTASVVLANGQVMHAAVEGDLALACVANLPDASGRNAIKNSGKENFIVYPGCAVSVDSDFSAFGNDAESAKKMVRDAITSAGLVYSEQPQSLKISVAARALPAEQRQMQRVASRFPFSGPFGPRTTLGEAETVSVPGNLVTLTLTNQGLPLWNQEFRFQGGDGLSLKQGQSMQEAMNADGPDQSQPLGLAQGSRVSAQGGDARFAGGAGEFGTDGARLHTRGQAEANTGDAACGAGAAGHSQAETYAVAGNPNSLTGACT
jgi:hypothetical protein